MSEGIGMELCTRRLTSALLIVTLFASTMVAPLQSAWAGKPGDDLKQIEYKYYFRGKYQQAIESLQVYLARVDLPEADAKRAREVLAASYVLGGAPVMGKQVFAEMIAKNPAYPGPDPNVFKMEVMDAYAHARAEHAALTMKNARPSEARVVGDEGPLRPQLAEESGTPIYKKWWFYAGAAALLVAAGVAVGGGDEGSSPPPPSGTVTVGVVVE